MKYSDIMNKLDEEMILRGFSIETKKTYSYNIKKFFEWINRSSLNPSEDTVRRYMLYLNSKKYDVNTIRLIQASLSFLFENILNKKVLIDKIPRPKKKKQIPKVLTKDEINIIIEKIKNSYRKYS